MAKAGVCVCLGWLGAARRAKSDQAYDVKQTRCQKCDYKIKASLQKSSQFEVFQIKEFTAVNLIRVPMEEYVLVAAEEGGEICEVDLESNGTLGLGTVQAMFGEQVTLLQYRNPTTGMLRVVRVSDGAIQAPKSGWGKTVYFVSAVRGESAIATLCIKSENHILALMTPVLLSCLILSRCSSGQGGYDTRYEIYANVN